MKLLRFWLGAPLFFVLYTSAQQKAPSLIKTVSGIVTNQRGEPLVNANVTNMNGRGTITNEQGRFTLKKVANDDVLKVSFIGYVSQSLSVDNQLYLKFVLIPTDNELDKVVVQAYGITSRRLATGNIATVSSEELERHPIVNPIRAIQGLAPGAVITTANGSSSSNVKIEIRGRNTINPSLVSEPLYIIDGVPLTVLNLAGDKVQTYVGGTLLSQGAIQSGIPSAAGAGQSPLYGINPNDIESIEVLKDADATAIYGSRASNGAILITTKKGRSEKTRAEVSVYTGISQVPRYYRLLNTQEYVAMRKEALANDGLPINNQTATDLVVWDTTRYTDWQKYMWGGNGKRTSVQGSLSGGDLQTNFRAAAGYDYDKDIVTLRGGNYRGSFSLNLQHRSKDKRLQFSFSSIYSISTVNATNKPGSILLPPNAPPVFDNYGKLNYAGWRPSYYPFGSLLESYESRTNFLTGNIKILYEIINGLSFSTSIGYNNSQNFQVKMRPISSQDAVLNPKGTLQNGSTNIKNVIIEPKLEYSTYVQKGKLSILVGATSQSNNTDGLQNWGTNYSNDLLISSINNAPNRNISAYQGQYKYAGVFARASYNWASKYMLNLNARRDGSSRFGKGRQFGNFSSIGAAWIFTEESWMKKLRLLSFGKIRASFGNTGSDQIGDYAYLSLWQFGGPTGSSGTYNSQLPLTPIGFSDSLLQWEVNRKLEVGAAFGFLNDKITFDISWYRNRCNNQLVAFPTPAFTGYTSVTSNSPANVQNTGWELILNAKVINRRYLKTSIKGTFSLNRNKLLSYPNISQSPFKDRLIIGKPLSIGQYMKFISIDPQKGIYNFEDLNQDGFINNLDRYPIDLAPKFDGGLTASLTYKNWDISIFFYYRRQTGTNILASSGYAGTMSNQSTLVLNRWRKPGDVTSVGRFTVIGSPNDNWFFNYSDARISDASFIRLQNAYLSYTLPETLRKKAHMERLKVFIQGENLFFITNYKGVDPEVQVLGAMPNPRIMTLGISSTF